MAFLVVADCTQFEAANTIQEQPLSRYAETVLADKPVAYYRLGGTTEESAARDEITGRRGTFSGRFVRGVAGAIAGDSDTAVEFDSGQLSLGDAFDFPGAASYSLEAWIRLGSEPTAY